MRQALLPGTAGLADSSAAAAEPGRSGTAAIWQTFATVTSSQLASVACGAAGGTAESAETPAEDAAAAQWWAVAGLFAILFGGALGAVLTQPS